MYRPRLSRLHSSSLHDKVLQVTTQTELPRQLFKQKLWIRFKRIEEYTNIMNYFTSTQSNLSNKITFSRPLYFEQKFRIRRLHEKTNSFRIICNFSFKLERWT